MVSIRRVRGQEKLKKEKCEVCGNKEEKILNIHHIIPQCDERCHNNNSNLCILCPNCHNEVHVGNIILIGVYKSTEGRLLMWFRKDEEPPLEYKNWKIKDNNKVLRKGH